MAVIYSGSRRYRLSDRVEVVPLAELATLECLFGP